MDDLATNYLALEWLLIARLKDQVSDLADNVVGAADLDGVTDRQVQTPGAHVIYLGDQVPEQNGARAGCDQIVWQRWVVYVVVRNVRSRHTAEDLRADAGGLLVTANQALQGWRPSPDFSPLLRITPPAVRYRGGNGYFPLAYKSRITSRGAP